MGKRNNRELIEEGIEILVTTLNGDKGMVIIYNGEKSEIFSAFAEMSDNEAIDILLELVHKAVDEGKLEGNLLNLKPRRRYES